MKTINHVIPGYPHLDFNIFIEMDWKE